MSTKIFYKHSKITRKEDEKHKETYMKE